MKIVASPGVAELVGRSSGRLYVWVEHARCCGGGLTLLETGSEEPSGEHAFISVEADGFQLRIDPGRRPLPEELNLEVRRGLRGSRVEAYWNGCVFAD